MEVAIMEFHNVLASLLERFHVGSSFDWHRIMHQKFTQIHDNVMINMEKTRRCLALSGSDLYG